MSLRTIKFYLIIWMVIVVTTLAIFVVAPQNTVSGWVGGLLTGLFTSMFLVFIEARRNLKKQTMKKKYCADHPNDVGC